MLGKDVQLSTTNSLREAIRAIDSSGLGAVMVVDGSGRFARLVSDGDVRRHLIAGGSIEDRIDTLAAVTPITAPDNTPPAEAHRIMRAKGVHQLPLIDGDGRPARLLSITDCAPILLSVPHLDGSELDRVADAIRSNWIAPLGPEVDAFEKDLATRTGMNAAAAVSSGTAAIHLALILLGVKRGDPVLCSTLTFVGSANPILYEGAEPIFIDSDPGTWNMSPEALERALVELKREGRTPKAVIVVNLYGQSARMNEIVALCEAYGVPMIEDAAESLGATYIGRQSGSFGRLSVFSFNGNKIITTSGGGALLSNDPDLIAGAKFLATQGREPARHYEHTRVAYNYRMSNLLAALGRSQLDRLDDRVHARRRVFDRYQAALGLAEGISWMPEPEGFYSTRWLTAGIVTGPRASGDNEPLFRLLADHNIEARPVWKPMHLQPLFAGRRYFAHEEGNSFSDNAFRNGICLPSSSSLADSEIDRVVDALRSYLGARRAA